MAMQPATAMPVMTPPEGGPESELDAVAQSLLNPEPEGEQPDPEDSPDEEPAGEDGDLDPEADADGEDQDPDEPEGEDEDEPQESDEDDEELAADDAEDDDFEDEVFEVKVDGKIQQVTLEDLKRNYSGNQAIDARLQEASEAKKAADAMIEQVQQQAQQADMVARLAYEAIVGEVANPDIDWEALYEVDPTEWAHQRELLRAKQEQANAKVAQLQQAAQQNAEAARQREAEAMHELKQQQGAILREAYPIFNQREEGETRRKAVIAFALERYGKYGVTEEMITDVSLAAPLIMLNDLYDTVNGNTKATVAAKKKQRRKRSVRPGTGTRTDQSTRSKKRAERLEKRAYDSGHPDDVAATMFETK